VEKEVFFLTLARDEPETLVGETGYSSCLHVQWKRMIKSIAVMLKCLPAGRRGDRSLLPWISAD